MPNDSSAALPAPVAVPSIARDITLVVAFAGLTVAVTQLGAIPVGLEVPLTLQTAVVLLSGLVLGPVRGAAAQVLYLAAGAVGLPVFAQGAAGVGVILGVTGGYLIAFPVAAFVAGVMSRPALTGARHSAAWWMGGAALVAGIGVIHPLGVAGLVILGRLTAHHAVVLDATFLPGDLIKVAVAASVALGVHRAVPGLRQRRAAAPVGRAVEGGQVTAA